MLPASLNQPPLTLLSEALADYAKGHQSPFLAKVIHALFEQVIAEDANTTQLPDGRSILVEAYHAAPTLGIGWWKLRGPEAWRPTEATSQPLASLISRNPKATFSRDRFWPIDRTVYGVRTARQFLDDGLAYAMPVSHAHLAALPAGQPLDRELRARLRAQELLVDFCLQAQSDRDLSASQKLDALISTGGALPTSCFGSYQVGQFLDHYPDGIFAPMVHVPRLGKKTSEPVFVAFHEHWADQADRPRLAQVISRLKRAGISCEKVLDAHAIDEALTIERRLRGKNISPVRSWEELVGKLEEFKNGWQLTNEDGLLWQQLLGRRPEMLYHALSQPGLDWQAVSPNGLGMWDHLDQAICQGVLPSTNLSRLAAKCPPRLLAQASTPLLWSSWWSEPVRAQAFFRETIQSHAGFWLGSSKRQWMGAIQQLLRWSEDNDKTSHRASLALNLLWDPAVDRNRLSPDLKVLMAVFEHAARRDPDTLDKMPNLKVHPLPANELIQPNRKLLDYLHRKLGPRHQDEPNPRAVWLQDACLEVFTPSAAPASRRASRL